MTKEQLKNKYEEVKTYIGYEMPLKKSEYAKDKVSVGVSFTIGAEEIDMERYQKIADQKADFLAQSMTEKLMDKGSEMIDGIVEQKVEGIRQEYESSLRLARDYVKNLIDQLKANNIEPVKPPKVETKEDN